MNVNSGAKVCFAGVREELKASLLPRKLLKNFCCFVKVINNHKTIKAKKLTSLREYCTLFANQSNVDNKFTFVPHILLSSYRFYHHECDVNQNEREVKSNNINNNDNNGDDNDDLTWDAEVLISSNQGWHEYRLESSSSKNKNSEDDNANTIDDDEEDEDEDDEDNVDQLNDADGNKSENSNETDYILNNSNNNNTSCHFNDNIYGNEYRNARKGRTSNVHVEHLKSLVSTAEHKRDESIRIAAEELQQVMEEQIRAEVERDSNDGFAAIPPLAPPNWAVHHLPGTSFFTMTRTLKPEFSRQDKEGRENYRYDDKNNQNNHNNYYSEETNGYDVPKFRSVYDEQIAKQHQHKQRKHTKEYENHKSQLTWSTSQHRYVAATSASELESSSSSSSSTVQKPVKERNVVRSDTHLTIFAPFRVLDLSLLDPHVSICEWSCFDLFVHKTAPQMFSPHRNANNNYHSKFQLRGQQRIWDDNECLFMRLASVNSELRIRGIQFISSSQVRALNEHAFFGAHGDPYYHYLHLQYTREEQRRALHAKTSPLSYNEPFTKYSESVQDTTRREVIVNNVTVAFPHERATPSQGNALVTHCIDERGEYARSLCYGGPYVTELSEELRDVLMTYLMNDLKVDMFLTEYICQMQYFLEHEEYMRWLAKSSYTGEVMRKLHSNNKHKI